MAQRTWTWGVISSPLWPSDYPTYILTDDTGQEVFIPAMPGNPEGTARLRDRVLGALNDRCNCHAASGNHLDSCPESFNYRDA